jgi:hypothetical protein
MMNLSAANKELGKKTSIYMAIKTENDSGSTELLIQVNTPVGT